MVEIKLFDAFQLLITLMYLLLKKRKKENLKNRAKVAYFSGFLPLFLIANPS